MVNKLGYETIVTEFDSYLVPHFTDFVPQLS